MSIPRNCKKCNSFFTTHSNGKELCDKCAGQDNKEYCEWTICHVDVYETSCGLDYETKDRESKYCRKCGKQIRVQELEK